MRRKFIAGNWKMFTNAASGEQLAQAVVAGMKSNSAVDVALCPPFPYLSRIAQIVKGSNIKLGAQNCYSEKEGAFTGEVSAAMLADVGCQMVILGHSERRQVIGETDEFINRKVHAALLAGLQVIVCIGETLEQRDLNRTKDILEAQLSGSLANLTPQDLARITIAYEPVWAIGTGKVATPEQAQEMHAFIRHWLTQRHGPLIANALIIQYGGSVKPDNAAAILSQPDVDGALVGGASLKADQFLAIIQAG